MPTTPTDRVTLLARRLRVDIDTATFPASNYQELIGKRELNPIIEGRTEDDEGYSDEGWMREASTGGNWRVEVKISHSTTADGVTINPVQAFLRTKFIAQVTSGVNGAEFGVRFYDKNGRASGYEFEGRCFVKSWTRDSNAAANLEVVTIVLQGQGPITPITNPVASLVPVVTGLSPAGGGTAGGNLVNIYGQKFTGVTGAAGVKFGANNATNYMFVNDSHIVATAPAGVAGTVQVSVTTPAGTSANTAADDYTYA
jgi:IPT/TIG domain